MKMQKVNDILNGLIEGDNNGFVVSFETKRGSGLAGDYFPCHDTRDVIDLEPPPFRTEHEAWIMAIRFAEKTKGKCINIHVVDCHFKETGKVFPANTMIKNQ